MSIYNFIKAVAGKLAEIWPERHIWINRLPGGPDGELYIILTGSSEEKQLGRRVRRSLNFELLMLPPEGDTAEFCQWAEAMYSGLDRLCVEDGDGLRQVRLKSRKARQKDDGTYSFSFSADFGFLLVAEPEEKMKELLEIKI